MSSNIYDMFDEDPLEVHDEGNILDRRRALRISRVAKEYVIDFDLVKAVARAGCDWQQCKRLEKDPTFISLVQELVETIDPDVVISRQQLLMQVKKEAFNPANKGSERINALTLLAKLLGMELPTSSKGHTGAPILNITLNTNGNTPKQVIEIEE